MHCPRFNINDGRFLLYLAGVQAAFRRNEKWTGERHVQGVRFLRRTAADCFVEVLSNGGNGVVLFRASLAFRVKRGYYHANGLRLELTVKDLKYRPAFGAGAYRARPFFANFRDLPSGLGLHVGDCGFVMDLYRFNCGDRARDALYLCKLWVINGAYQAYPARISPGIGLPQGGCLDLGNVATFRDVTAVVLGLAFANRHSFCIKGGNDD